MRRRLLVVASASLAACAPSTERSAPPRADAAAVAPSPAASAEPAPQKTPAAAPQDSVRGVIESVGNEPQTELIVRQHDGSTCAVSAALDALPASVAGLEVALWGTRAKAAPAMMPGVTCAFHATRYAVRAADGVPAMDGVLHADGASFTLELASGERRPLRHVPSVLRARVGAHIFWAGPLDRAPAAYGVLREPPR